MRANVFLVAMLATLMAGPGCRKSEETTVQGTPCPQGVDLEIIVKKDRCKLDPDPPFYVGPGDTVCVYNQHGSKEIRFIADDKNAQGKYLFVGGPIDDPIDPKKSKTYTVNSNLKKDETFPEDIDCLGTSTSGDDQVEVMSRATFIITDPGGLGGTPEAAN